MAGNQNPGYPNVVAGRAASGNTPTDIFMDPTAGALYTGLWVWNTSTLVWEKMTQPKTTDNAEVYGYNGTNWHEARIDTSTRAFETIEYAHHEIHAGSSFVCSDLRNVSTTTFKWQVTTPAGTKYAHMVFDIDCTGEMLVLITEGSDRTDGTALVELNRNRVGTPTAATVIVTHTPTGGATDGTTVLVNHRSGATGVGSKTISAGGMRGVNEFVLKPSTKYVISVTTYADVWVSLDIDWYEHTDKAV